MLMMTAVIMITINLNFRFHLAASKGLINSLNVFLDNGVNVKAVDAAGNTSFLFTTNTRSSFI